MKKILLGIIVLVMGASIYAFPGDINPQILKEVGVSETNINAVEKIVDSKRTEVRKNRIEEKRKELELDEALLEENVDWSKVEKIVRELHSLRADHQIDMLKTKKEIEKYITPDQYRRARQLGKRRKGMRKNNKRDNFKQREEFRSGNDFRPKDGFGSGEGNGMKY